MTDTPPTAEVPDAPEEGRLHVPPWVQLVGLPLLVLFGYFFVRAASHAVVVFVIAGLISLLLAPVVRKLVSFGIPRLVSVLIVFGAFATIVTSLTLVGVDLVTRQAAGIGGRIDAVASTAIEQVDALQRFADERSWDIDVRDQGELFVQQLEERSTELSGEALNLGTELVTVLAEAAFNLVLIVVVSIYMLLDAPRISRMIASIAPNRGIEQLFGRLERSLLRYTVGQTLASAVMGFSAFLGLWVMGKVGIWDQADEYAVLFALIVAITEFAPSIGPAVGSIPPIVTAIFDGPGPAIAVAVFYLLLHQIEGHIVIPKLMGSAIAVHPLLVIFGIVAGAQIMGIGGMLLALPLLAVGREIALFLRERLLLGRWPDPSSAVLVGGPAVAAAGGKAASADAEPGADGRAARTLRERARVFVPRRWRATDDDAT